GGRSVNIDAFFAVFSLIHHMSMAEIKNPVVIGQCRRLLPSPAPSRESSMRRHSVFRARRPVLPGAADGLAMSRADAALRVFDELDVFVNERAAGLFAQNFQRLLERVSLTVQRAIHPLHLIDLGGGHAR